MDERVKKLLKTGYGLGILSLEQAKKAALKVKKELDFDEKQSKALAKELVKNSKSAAMDVAKTLNKHFEDAIVKTGLTNKREIKRVKKVVKKRIKKKVEYEKKQVKKLIKKKPSILKKVKSKLKRKK
jgi:polyhydroxyalkanoate synthesis regulator phasin